MSSPNSSIWSSFEKIGFRFAFIYFIQIICFQNNGAFPFWDKIFVFPSEWLQSFIPWIGSTIYGITDDIVYRLSGSGDTLFDYLVILTAFLIAICGTVVWSVIDRKRTNYTKLYYWLTVGVRYYVALMLISYGMVKVIQLQFPNPGFYRLLEPYGESSPMGLAWTFLGFSKGYNIFMGTAELLAGLLLFRRTMTFGALITFMTAINIMAINYCYDVPVKILSTHLAVMSLFLLTRDIKKIALFFFTNMSAKLERIKRPVLKNQVNIALNSFKVLLLGYVFIYGAINVLESEKLYGSKAPKPELFGAYKVDNYIVNGDTITSYKNDQLWKSISIQREGSLQIRHFGKLPSYYGIEKDSLNDGRLKFTSWRNEGDEFYFNYKTVDGTRLEFNFIREGDTVTGSAIRLDKNDFLLINRGFHWISEYPYNR